MEDVMFFVALVFLPLVAFGTCVYFAGYADGYEKAKEERNDR